MTPQQTFRSLGSITFAMTKWIKLRQWARRNGQTQTVENCDKWIADCQARGQRINKLNQPELKKAETVLAVSEFGLHPVEAA